MFTLKMVKVQPFTAACVFCLLSFVMNIEHVLTMGRSSEHDADYDDYEGTRDYERELQSMVRRVKPLMGILRNKQQDIDPPLGHFHGDYSSSSIRNHGRPRPLTPNNFIRRLDQHSSPMMGPSILSSNALGPGMIPGKELASALAMLNPNAIKRQDYSGADYGGGSYGGVGQNSELGSPFSTLGLVSIVATALLYLLFFYYVSTSTSSTTRRRKRAHQDYPGQQLEDEFGPFDVQDMGRFP